MSSFRTCVQHPCMFSAGHLLQKPKLRNGQWRYLPHECKPQVPEGLPPPASAARLPHLSLGPLRLAQKRLVGRWAHVLSESHQATAQLNSLHKKGCGFPAQAQSKSTKTCIARFGCLTNRGSPQRSAGCQDFGCVGHISSLLRPFFPVSGCTNY